MTESELIADITTKLQIFEESNLIDPIFIKNWIKDGLKEFGGNIMQEEEVVLEVENGKAKLPDNFYAFKFGLKCDPIGYSINKEKENILFASTFYQERVKKTAVWLNSIDPPCRPGYECEYIKEESIFLDKKGQENVVQFWYNTPVLFKLVRGYNKLKCDKGCQNLTIDSPYEVSIQNNNYLNCNFQKGAVYLRYRGLPTNEFGELLIPETSRNSVKDYLEYKCTRRTLENIWVNDDKPDVVTKLNYFRQLENEYYLKAKNDTIDDGLLGWREKVKNQLRKRTRKFELMYSNI